MSNKLEATFHGPPPEPLPQRDPFMTLADWDGTWRTRAEVARRSPEPPPWVQARRAADAYDPRWHQVMIGIAGAPVAGTETAPPPPPPPPTRPRPAWFVPAVAGAAGFLAFVALLALVLALGL